MTQNTKIEWCDATVNHWAGCTAVSPACDNCYAKRMAGRLWGTQWGPGLPRHQFAGADKTLRALDRKAQRQGRPLRVFHNSLSDFFDNDVPVQWRISAMRSIVETPNLIHILLTKRIGNAAEMLDVAFRAVHGQREKWADNVPSNVWIGATIVNQPEADRDIPKLLQVPARVRFLSMEPLLGAVNLRCISHGDGEINALKPDTWEEAIDLWRDTSESWIEDFEDWYGVNLSDGLTGPAHAGIDWVIVGGESGHGARPMHPEWARSLRDQCEAAGVPFLFKQWGEWGEPDSIERTNLAHQGWFEQDRLDGGVPRHEWQGPMQNGVELASLRPEVFRVGKKAAGRLLDGREWNGAPAC